MSKKIERREMILIFFCAAVYFFNYFCRYNFVACLASMIEGLGTTKTFISIALTGNAITYGAGQAICGILGDKISPRYFITVGLVGSALCNLGVSAVSSVPVIWVLWAINGILQAMIWPALVRVQTENLSREAYTIAAAAVSYACNISTFVIYMGLVPLCLSFATWRMAFIIPGIITVLIGLAWFFFLPRLYKKSGAEEVKQETKEVSEAKGGFFRAVLRAGLPLVFICVLLQGILRDGIGEWMPSFIIETYNLANAGAVMTAAILPAFSVLCVFLTVRIYRRLKNEQLSALVLWGASAVSALLLFFFYEGSALLAVGAMTVLNGSMHGINHLLTCRISPYFVKYNRVSTVTGIINCFPYIGSAIAAPLSAYLSDTVGWGMVILMWMIVAVAGLGLTALHLKSYTRFIKEEE